MLSETLICFVVSLEQFSRAQPNRTPRCMEKVMLVDELEYDTRIKCHHSYGKSCFNTYITVFKPAT
eukprot:TCALIF_04792-PA protein Name:"Protein of unknown function" AED:0.44 eAED:0.44 QI:0/0/0/0.5/0/0.5/2/0/65